jgi:hypothetical protein
MWLFTIHGFYSLNTDPTNSQCLQFRARSRRDLQNLKQAFPEHTKGAMIKQIKGTDYPFRISLHRLEAQDIVAEIARDIDYSNFKHQLEGTDQESKVPYLNAIWAEMREWQESCTPSSKNAKQNTKPTPTPLPRV